MKEIKNEASSSGSSSGRSDMPTSDKIVVELKRGCCRTVGWHNINAGFCTVAVLSFMIFVQVKDMINPRLFEDFKKAVLPNESPEVVDLPQHWNSSAHEFVPLISDWGDRRRRFMEADPTKAVNGGRPKVLMVTGSSQDDHNLPLLSHLLLRAGKNKQDYTQMHDMDLYYNMVNPDPEFSDWWVKLPVIRMLMLRHPEVEFIWWLDADAIITDMTFEPPFAKLSRYNLVIYGDESLVYDSLDPTGISTGAFMIRNCQWSLDLLDAWAYTGTDRYIRREKEFAGSAKFQQQMKEDESLNLNRAANIVRPGDDRSSLIALLALDKRNLTSDGQDEGHRERWVPWVYLVEETEYHLNADWKEVAPNLEKLNFTGHGANGNGTVPFVTHFEGCLPSLHERPDLSKPNWKNFKSCTEQISRALDFAENQVYAELGLGRYTLGNSMAPFVWTHPYIGPVENVTGNSTESRFKILPMVLEWDATRKAYLERNPWTPPNHVVIVSGSSPNSKWGKDGSHLTLRAFKNKVDYSRVHGIRIFYNMAIIHQNLTGWWSKLPAVKLMMINSLDVEWIWWTDSDAIFTNMDLEIPFDKYDGYNLIMYGNNHLVYDLRKYNGINTGNYIIRNCQWSLDLLDRWASSAGIEQGHLNSVLSRPDFVPDDQSLLVYLLVKEPEKWADKVYFEEGIVLSGEWQFWTTVFTDEYELRPESRPLVTHFTGCSPWDVEACLQTFERDDCDETSLKMCVDRAYRALNFADNQVLETYGLRHERLNTSNVIGEFLRYRQQFDHCDIGKMMGMTKEELAQCGELFTATIAASVTEILEVSSTMEEVNSTKEAGNVTTTMEEVNSTKEEGNVTTTVEGELSTPKENEEVTTPKEEEVTTDKEVVTTSEVEKVEEPAKKQEEVVEDKTKPKEEAPPAQKGKNKKGNPKPPTQEEKAEEPAKEQGGTGTSAKEEEMATTIEDEKLPPMQEEEGVTTSEVEKVEEPAKEGGEVTTPQEVVEDTTEPKEEAPPTKSKGKNKKLNTKSPTQEEQVEESTKEQEETGPPAKEEEVATAKEDEELPPQEELEGVTTSEVGKVEEPTKEQEEVTSANEAGEVTTPEELVEDLTTPKEEAPPTKRRKGKNDKANPIPPTQEETVESEVGKDSPQEVETFKEVEKETNTEEAKVDSPKEESETGTQEVSENVEKVDRSEDTESLKEAREDELLNKLDEQDPTSEEVADATEELTKEEFLMEDFPTTVDTETETP